MSRHAVPFSDQVWIEKWLSASMTNTVTPCGLNEWEWEWSTVAPADLHALSMFWCKALGSLSTEPPLTVAMRCLPKMFMTLKDPDYYAWV